MNQMQLNLHKNKIEIASLEYCTMSNNEIYGKVRKPHLGIGI